MDITTFCLDGILYIYDVGMIRNNSNAIFEKINAFVNRPSSFHMKIRVPKTHLQKRTREQTFNHSNVKITVP